ncbi:MAG: 2-C-methyl-D-erythritol 4-phosphate cytidylyltransferase [Bacteroidota bacterium]
MKRYAIIVAGGTGSRMGNDTPKQFLLLKGRPILLHSIEKFSSHCNEVIVVLPESKMEEWVALCEENNFPLNYRLVAGGMMRAESVKNGLEVIEGDGVVAIHDAARPLISEKLIEKLFHVAEQEDSAVPVIKLSDSLRKLQGKESKAVDRSDYRLVQTPQCFSISLIRKAFLQAGFRNFTDEASLAEAAGYTINLVDGEISNFKITLPEDLNYAESLSL